MTATTCAVVIGPKKSVVLRAEEFDGKALDTGEYEVHPEEPALGVIVAAEAPEDEKHQKASPTS